MAFRVSEVPNSWRQLDIDGALLAFRDDAHQATVLLNGRCGKDGDDVPLTSLTKHLFLYFTDRHVHLQEPMMLDGREALRTEETAKLDGVSQRFVSVVLKKDTCVYDFIHVTGPERDANSERAFDRFVSGFRTLAQ